MLFVIKNSSGEFFTKKGNGAQVVFGWTSDPNLDFVWKRDEQLTEEMLEYLKSLGSKDITKEPLEG